jgi:glycosyltransferase involved in cell wall biosynthesis
LAEEINFRLSDKIICVTEGIKREIVRRYKVNEGKLVVIPNGANIELFRPLDKHGCRRKLGLEEDAFYVGFVGSFAPWQGLDILIEAARQVKEQGYSQIKYILVGDGECEYILRQKVQGYKLEDEIRFTGRVAYEQVVNYMNACDVAVAPFTTKGSAALSSPLKLFEYLACGRPVIASRVDGVKEVIEEGKCGYLFEPGDAEELAKRIIQSYQERDALQEMGLRGRQLVESKYTWRATAKRIVEVLSEVVEEKSGQK